MTLRVLDTGLASARWNVAASAALLASVDAGRDATLRFHRFHSSCIVGRFQDLDEELDLGACRASEVAVARRVTGGGAVVMGAGILAFDLVLPGSGATLHRATARTGDALVAALAEFGFDATRPTPGSVAIDGLKVSGSAGRLARNALLHQATLILDLASAPPLSLLRRRTEGGKPTSDPRHRVTDLETAPRAFENRHDEPVLGTVMRCLTSRIADALSLRPEQDVMPDDERAHAAAILADTVGREEFVLEGDTERQAA